MASKVGLIFAILCLFLIFSSAIAAAAYFSKSTSVAAGTTQTPNGQAATSQAASTVAASAVITAAPTSASAASGSMPFTNAPVVLKRVVNFDLPGDNVADSATDPKTCSVLCTTTDGCSYYITDSAGQHCWLMKNPQALVQRGDRISYVSPNMQVPTPQFSRVANYDHWGDDLPSMPLKKNQADCNQACIDTAGCQYYVVDSAGNNCFLKNASADKPALQKRAGFDTWIPPGKVLPWSQRAGYDNTGNDLQYFDTDPITCSYNCGANTDCQFYITDTAGKKCWLKKSQGDDIPNNDRATWAAPGQAFQPKLYVWTDASFKGQSQWFYPGSYGWLPVWNFPSDAMSSLKVPPGFKVRLWDNKDMQGGRNIELGPGDYPNLKDQNFNDITSALQYYAA